jgi:hypothetical protein
VAYRPPQNAEETLHPIILTKLCDGVEASHQGGAPQDSRNPLSLAGVLPCVTWPPSSVKPTPRIVCVTDSGRRLTSLGFCISWSTYVLYLHHSLAPHFDAAYSAKEVRVLTIIFVVYLAPAILLHPHWCSRNFQDPPHEWCFDFMLSCAIHIHQTRSSMSSVHIGPCQTPEHHNSRIALHISQACRRPKSPL